MSKTRMIDTKFWDDNYSSNLDPIEKLLFLYFLTNTSTNISGIYEIPLKKIAVETGIEKEMVLKILDRFAKDGKIFYWEGWIAIKNFIKNQNQESPKVKKGIAEELKKVPVQILDLVNMTEFEYEQNPFLSRRQSVLVRDKFSCKYCNIEIIDDTFELDHIVPVSRGGKDLYLNTALSCRSCNQSKSDMTAQEFTGKNITGIPFHSEKALLALQNNQEYLKKIKKIYPNFSLETKVIKEKLDYKYPIASNLIKSNSIQSNITKEEELPLWLNKEKWNEWLEYRKQSKKKMTEFTIKKQLNFLETYKKDHIKIIDRSIMNGWQGLFPLDNKFQNNDAGKVLKRRIEDDEAKRERDQASSDNEAMRKINDDIKNLVKSKSIN